MTLESLKRDSYVSILTRAFARVQRAYRFGEMLA